MCENRKRILITGIVRNNARTLPRIIRRLLQLRSNIYEVAFALYENNSTDSTPEILYKMSQGTPNFRYKSETLSASQIEAIATARHKSGAPCRIEVIAHARERARALALEYFADYDYVLCVDTDAIIFPVAPIKRILDLFKANSLDYVCAQGLTKTLKFRDGFAFRSLEHPFGPELLGEYWWDAVLPQIQTRNWRKGIIPIYSGFGGAALMTMNAFKAGTYKALPDKDYEAARKKMDVRNAPHDEIERESQNPVANTNYTLPIICEHVGFCYSLRAQGFDKMFCDLGWRIVFLD